MSTVTTETEAGASEITVRNPRTGEVLYTLADPGDEALDQAYETARAAFERIRVMTVRERLDETNKLAAYIRDNKDSIMDRIIQETGKSRTDALMSEIFSVLDVIEYYDKHAEAFLADEKVKVPIVLMGKKARIFYEPIGPVLIISPWNYPFNLAMVPFLCAFIPGNSVVFKPSEWTPLRGLIEEVFEKSGFMENAMQVVYGGKETGRRLVERRPAKICFTGSTRAGRQVMAQAAPYLIPVELELGGKDPMVVFDDVNIDRTVNGALWGGIANCGQTCTAVERVFVQEGIYDRFVEELTAKANLIRTPTMAGKPDEGDLDVGCMTPGFQVDIVEDQLADARAKGAQVSSDGKRVPGTQELPPTIVTGADKSMKIHSEETFGPVLSVMKFKTEEEAIDLANDSEYGLSASVWSTDLERAERVARRIQTGNVSINNVLSTQAHAGLPFGGTKQSGFGRYKGAAGLRSFSNIKSVMIEKQSPKSEFYWYPFTTEKYRLLSTLVDTLFRPGLLSLLKTGLLAMKLERLAKKEKL